MRLVKSLGESLKMNKLYFGDNLEILRQMADAHVDLICTDPPFNSGCDYNAFLGDSLAQKKAFTDIWTWDTAAEESRADIAQRALSCDTYKALEECLRGYDFVLRRSVSGNKGAMRAYLAFMGPRLAEMHRVLSKNGSIYFHCDPTASHYLKGVMDAIWDQQNRNRNEFFRNEIVWSYRRPSITRSNFQRTHDIILRYSKSTNATWNRLYEPKPASTSKRLSDPQIKNAYAPDRRRFASELASAESKGVPLTDVWEISGIAPSSKEHLGYPTQKPRVLYERMIRASSNEGDIVLDPFCGFGTTIDAAHTLNRQWIGIDLTILALDPMRQRLEARHGLKPVKDYEIHGYPTNMQAVIKLIHDEKRYHDFSNWAVTQLGLQPTSCIRDVEYDGIGHFTASTPKGTEKTEARVIAEVKIGKPTITSVRSFCHVMDRSEAQAGIFVTIEPVTAVMRQLAENLGSFEHNGLKYPRLQFWQIDDDYFENPETVNAILRLPDEWRGRSMHKSERHFANKQAELAI